MTSTDRIDRQELEARRLRAAELFAVGVPQAEVARQLGVTRQSVNCWHARVKQGGTQALAEPRANRLPTSPLRSGPPTVDRPAAGGRRGQGEGQGGQDGDIQHPTDKAGERFKVACGCQPPRSFWIRATQYRPGRSPAGICGQDFQPHDTAPGHQPHSR
jgi:hypothetical protein